MRDNFSWQKNIFESAYSDDSDISKQASVKLIRSILNKEPNDLNILDVGCGDGKILAPFSRKNRIFGLDSSKNLLNKAKKRGYSVKDVNLEASWPFKDEFFDIVLASHVIEHIVDTDFFLSEANRVLKKSGKLILALPNVSNPLSFIMLLLDNPPNMGARYRSAHVRDFTIKTLKIALGNNGFLVKNILGASTFFPPYHSLTFLVKYFPRLARDIVVIAVKNKRSDLKDLKFDFLGSNLKD